MSQVGQHGGVDTSDLPRQLALWEYEYRSHCTQSIFLAVRREKEQCLLRYSSTVMCSTAQFATSSKLKGVLAATQPQLISYKHNPATDRISSPCLHQVCIVLLQQSTSTTWLPASHCRGSRSSHPSILRLTSRHRPLCCKVFALAILSSSLILHAQRFRCRNTKGQQSSYCRERVAAEQSGWL